MTWDRNNCSFSLNGQVAIVTGAARGLGAAIARGFAEARARVVLADLDARAKPLAANLRTAGMDCIAMSLDVRDETTFIHCFESAVRHFGGIDVLVNNAALTSSTASWEITADEWDDVMAVNLRGSFFGCRIAARHMSERGHGRIINLSSGAGQQPSCATGVHYAASKAGLLALTRHFARELAPQGVTVNAIAPAAVSSPALFAMSGCRRRLNTDPPLE